MSVRDNRLDNLDALAALAVLGAVGAGYGLQWLGGMEPCSFCLLERYLLIALGAAFALIALVPPLGNRHGLAAVLVLLPTTAGVAATVQHLRIQAGAAPATCGEGGAPAWSPLGPGLPAETAAPSGWWGWLPEAAASCAEPDRLLGIPLVVWALAAFLAFGGTGAIAHAVAAVRRSDPFQG